MAFKVVKPSKVETREVRLKLPVELFHSYEELAAESGDPSVDVYEAMRQGLLFALGKAGRGRAKNKKPE